MTAAPQSRRAALLDALRRLAPGIPRFDLEAAADHGTDSPALRKAPPETAAWLSLVAYVRHVHTDYDALLDDGYDVDAARFFVVDAMNEVLGDWECRRRVTGEEDVEG
ncbi:DUF2293 domain-containing protein [Novispirillum sp. DQ9]|uniref:DUF2293 domain-containing protein n=1 Tax=Novispirillum sp. DQ9 TaxID=3398612 RepID=UPI003C7AC9FD